MNVAVPTRRYGLWSEIGMQNDLLNIDPNAIDLDELEAWLWRIRRFNSHPRALILRQHTWLVEELAAIHGQPKAVLDWCRHHDDHEAVIGDILGPLKSLCIQQEQLLGTPAGHTVLERVEAGLDRAICQRRGMTYPCSEIRATVLIYDKLAETLEWTYAMHKEGQPWIRERPHWISEQMAIELVQAAQMRCPPLDRGTNDQPTLFTKREP